MRSEIARALGACCAGKKAYRSSYALRRSRRRRLDRLTEHGLNTTANLVHHSGEVAIRRRYLDRFTHMDGDREGSVHGRDVGQIFFQSLDGLEHALDAWRPFKVAGRIER